MEPALTAHVWTVAEIDEHSDRAIRLRAVLSADERRRLSRFRCRRTRSQYLTAHALLRHALSAVVGGVAPGAWVFTTGPGRPEIARPATGARFSLSRTDGAVACVVTDGPSCGVDIEPLGAPVELAEAFAFTEAERHWIGSAPPGERRARRLALWTRKEAYGKARGEGLSTDVRATDLRPSRPRGGWRFAQYQTRRHFVSLAVEHPGRLRRRLHRTFPSPRP